MEPHRWSLEAPLVRVASPISRGVIGPSRTPPVNRWRRASYGRYVPADAQRSLEQRIVDQASRLSPGQAVTGWAALRWWGAGLFDGLAADGSTVRPVPLAVGTTGAARQNLGGHVFRDRLPAHDLVSLDGLRLTTVSRATFDQMRLTGDLGHAVEVLDMVIGAGLLGLADFEEWLAHRKGWHGIRLAREALPLARFGVRSPQETRLRLVAQRAGAGELLVNHTVTAKEPRWKRSSQRSGPGESDLLDPEAGVIMEFDGADHRSREQHRRDLAKDDAAWKLQLPVARFTSADLHHERTAVERIRATYARALNLPEDERPWIAHPPPARVNDIHQLRLRQISAP